MQVDEDFNIRFVKLVQKHKCLYDKKVPEYRNKDFQEKSWLEIASETRESVPHCKERWRNLRACLSRYIKQQNSSDPQHKPYYLTEHMQFVLPFLKSARQSISNNNSNNTNNNNFNYDLKSEVNTQDKQSDPEETEDGYEDGGGITQNYVPNFSSSAAVAAVAAAAAVASTKHSQRLNDIKPTPVNCIPDVPNVVDIEHQHHHHHHHQRQSSIDERPPPPEPEVMFMTSSSTATERLQSERKRIKIEHHYADENSDMDFFKSILPDISNMNALQKRKFKIGVLELIDDVLDKYPERKSPSHHHHHHQHHQHQHQSSQPPQPPPPHMTEIPNGYWRKS